MGLLMLFVLFVGVLVVIGFFIIEFVFKLFNVIDNLMLYIFDYMGLWYLLSIFFVMLMVGNSVLWVCGDICIFSIVMVVGGGLNVLFDFIFIFGFGFILVMGIKGVVFVIFIVWIVGVLWIFYILVVCWKLMLFWLLIFVELCDSSCEIFKIGLFVVGVNMFIFVVGGVMIVVVVGYGVEVVVVWGVGNRMEFIVSIVVLVFFMILFLFIS